MSDRLETAEIDCVRESRVVRDNRPARQAVDNLAARHARTLWRTAAGARRTGAGERRQTQDNRGDADGTNLQLSSSTAPRVDGASVARSISGWRKVDNQA